MSNKIPTPGALAAVDALDIADEVDLRLLSRVEKASLIDEHTQPLRLNAEEIARYFHETYERLAPQYGYKTRKASSVPWEKVPERNRTLMVAVARALLDKIEKKESLDDSST